jgi:hypothetical protein
MDIEKAPRPRAAEGAAPIASAAGVAAAVELALGAAPTEDTDPAQLAGIKARVEAILLGPAEVSPTINTEAPPRWRGRSGRRAWRSDP